MSDDGNSFLFGWRSVVCSDDGPDSPTMRLTLLVLSLHMNASGASCHPSLRTVARESGLTERTVCTQLDRAAAAGWIVRTKVKRRRAGSGWLQWEYRASVPAKVAERLSATQVAERDSSTREQVTEAGSYTSPEVTESHAQVTESHDTRSLKQVQTRTSVEDVKEGRRNMSGDNAPDDAEPRSRRNSQNAQLRAAARRVLDFLNEKTGRNYEPVPANLDMIAARLKEGASEDHCRMVIVRKCDEWNGDEHMHKYLRPKTLFNRTNFANYKGELVAPRREAHRA